MTGGNLDLPREVARRSAAAGLRERLLLALSVEDHVAVAHRDPVTRAGDDALDERRVRLRLRGRVAQLGGRQRAIAALVVALGARRRVEDDDVADRRVGEVRADPVDEHTLADLQGRDHRLGRDAVRLDEERLDARAPARARPRRS